MIALRLPLPQPVVLPLVQLRAIFRLARLGLHLLWGCATIVAVFPFIGLPKRRWLKQRWSRQLLQVLGVGLKVSGPAPTGLVVANHVSFLDIYAINATAPAAFVSKDDVLSWPVIGWLSRHTETIFLARGSRTAAQRTREALVQHLAAGHLAALFPEGTTSDGQGLLPFHGALFQSAIDAAAPVTPIALRYRDGQGRLSTAPAYIDDITLGQCLWTIASSSGLTVEVRVLSPQDSTQADRRHLAAHCHHGIGAALRH
ncbi:lysophospholipid acyltransferase family protein [Denitratisoma sp. agr-D3]